MIHTQWRRLHTPRLFCLICHKTKACLISLLKLVISDHWSLIGVSRFFGNLFVEEFPGLPKTIRRVIRRSAWALRIFRVLGKVQGTGQGGREGCITTLPRGNAARC